MAPALLHLHPAVPQSTRHLVFSGHEHTFDPPRHREGRSEVTMGPCLLQDQSCLWPMRVGDKEDMWLLLCSASIEHRLIYMGNSMFLIPGVGTTLLRSLWPSESYAPGSSPCSMGCVLTLHVFYFISFYFIVPSWFSLQSFYSTFGKMNYCLCCSSLGLRF